MRQSSAKCVSDLWRSWPSVRWSSARSRASRSAPGSDTRVSDETRASTPSSSATTEPAPSVVIASVADGTRCERVSVSVSSVHALASSTPW
eukprot:6172766-Pleurochrysis_carterae.AAC.7